MKTKLCSIFALILLLNLTTFAADNWKEKFQKELPLLGHRNWIVVADAAYPLQTAPGIETIYVEADQLEVVKGVRPAGQKWHADYGDYLNWICPDPELAAAFGGVISYHSYWSDRLADQLVPDREQLGREAAKHPGWTLWQSEYCGMEPGRDYSMDTALRVAQIIHCDLTLASASAWQWWLAVASEDYKSGLLHTDYKRAGDRKNIIETKTFWALGNYSRFIRPGMVRVQVSGQQDIKGVMASAYLNPHAGKMVLVLLNASRQPSHVQLHWAKAGGSQVGSRQFIPFTTASGTNLAPGQPFDPGSGFEMPARSVITLVENNDHD